MYKLLHGGHGFADFVRGAYQRVYDQVDRDQVDDFADVHLERVENAGTDAHDHPDGPVNVVDPTADRLVDGGNDCEFNTFFYIYT